jgi:hypothetical protein
MKMGLKKLFIVIAALSLVGLIACGGAEPAAEAPDVGDETAGAEEMAPEEGEPMEEAAPEEAPAEEAAPEEAAAEGM